MTIDFFESNRARQIVFVLICIAAFFGPKIIAVPQITNQEAMPLAKATQYLLDSKPWISIVSNIILLFACAISFITILSIFDTLPKRQYTATAIFFAIVSVFVTEQNMKPTLIALLLQMFVAYQIFNTYRLDGIKAPAFTAAFIASLSALFMMQSATTILYIVIGIWIFNVITSKSTIALLLGTLAPIVFCLCFYHLILHDTSLFFSTISSNFEDLINNRPELNNPLSIYAGVVIFFTILAILKISNKVISKVVQRKICQTFCFTFFIAIATIVLAPEINFATCSLLAMPSAYIIAQFSLMLKRGLIANIMLWIIFAGTIICNYAN